jgi:hypothetical protein
MELYAVLSFIAELAPFLLPHDPFLTETQTGLAVSPPASKPSSALLGKTVFRRVSQKQRGREG